MFERGRLRNGVAGNDRQGRERRHGHVVDDGPFGAFQQWQEGACDIERSEEVDSQLLLEGLGIAQIVVESDAGIVDEDVEGVDPVDRPLDLLHAGHIKRQWGLTFIGDCECAACSRIDPLRSAPQRLIDERLTDASVGASDQDCFLRDVHDCSPFWG
jgi:hypothetical protein